MRQIARRVGLSRGTIHAMGSGQRPLDYSRQLADERARRRPPVLTRGAAVRCPGCGAMVEMPCLACWLRSLLASGRRLPRIVGREDPEEPLTIALKDEDFDRYLAVRRQKEDEILAGRVDDAGDPADDAEPTDAELWEVESPETPISRST